MVQQAGNPRNAGAGGVIRDDQGRWLKGFCANLVHASNISAEHRAIWLALKLSINSTRYTKQQSVFKPFYTLESVHKNINKTKNKNNNNEKH